MSADPMSISGGSSGSSTSITPSTQPLPSGPVLSCRDPRLIAGIPIRSKINNPLLLPWLSPQPSSEIPDTTLPFPWTLTNPQDLWHYIIALQDPQMTLKIPDHISVFIILF